MATRLRCPYCGHGLGSEPCKVCPACGKGMRTPDSVLPLGRRDASRRSRELIRQDAERVRKHLMQVPAGLVRQKLSMLAGILIGMLLLGWMMVGRVKAPPGRVAGGSPLATASRELDVLRIALEQFRRDCGRLPTAAEGLTALVLDPGLEGWQGPYVTLVQRDPWHHRYVYDVRGGGEVILFSAGPDGQQGTADDLLSEAPLPEEIPPSGLSAATSAVPAGAADGEPALPRVRWAR